jgi:hypothetical protein
MKHKKGYCRICNKYDILEKDHIPPKSCFNSDVTYVYEYVGGECLGVKYKGIEIRTICPTCNRMLGNNYDPELARFAKDVMINYYKKQIGSILFNKLEFTYNFEKIVKSIIGHLLSATGHRASLLKPYDDNENFTFNKMRKVLNQNDDEYLSQTKMLIWLHPHRTIEIQNNIVYGDLSGSKSMIHGSLLKFFPFGFWFIDKSSLNDFFNFNLDEIDIKKKSIIIDFNKILPNDFPFNLLDSSLSQGVFMMDTEHAIKGLKNKTFRDTKIYKIY